jgi:hypothetical protein
MLINNAKRLTFPLPISYWPTGYIDCQISRLDAADILGPPMLTDWWDGLGMCDLWGFESPCGMKLAFQFFHSGKGGVILDSPEIEHALRHIPFPSSVLSPMPIEVYSEVLTEIAKLEPQRRSEIDALKAFQVWRIDDNGNVFAVGEPTSERDARCLVQQYEARGHKQMYWVAPIKQ